MVVRWYGLIITSAVLIGYAIAHRRVKSRGQDPEHLTNILIIALVSAVIGARLYYVLFSLSDYLANPVEIFAIWHGGLAIHGALIGGILSTVWYTRRYGLNFWLWADLIIPSMILGQAIGRWGNYMNQEAFGSPTSLPWAIYISPVRRPAEFAGFSHFHPTFLYESIWNLLGFALLMYLSHRQRLQPKAWPTGSLLLVYGIYYSIGRGMIEGLRTDSLMLGPIRVAQLISVIIIVGCAGLLYSWRRQSDPKNRPEPGKKVAKKK
ncbi:MAG TPA: prolipoprotein diacylglyceryl transferase [Actinobacteria bacterium]|nr:prolipoprotein diacylglyceryl transferase [Actinomycetota bacterium]